MKIRLKIIVFLTDIGYFVELLSNQWVTLSLPKLVSVSIDFPSNLQWNTQFHRIVYEYSHADWDGLSDHLIDVPWEDIFKLGASASASDFCEWVQVGIDLYIPHRKYQVKPHSSPWFSAACAAAIVYRNHFFSLHQKDKFSDSKVKFRQASNCCK